MTETLLSSSYGINSYSLLSRSPFVSSHIFTKVFTMVNSLYTLMPRDYDSFVTAILSQNHWKIDIRVNISEHKSHNCLTKGVFQ